MNCRDAREQLDAARPGPIDRGEPEFAAAMAHVADCAGCRDVVQDRERFDRNIGRVMQDVAVPAGLKARILDSLRVAAEAETAERLEAASTPPQPRLRNRRWLLTATGTVAVVLLAALAFRFWWPSARQADALLTLADLRQQATLTGLSELQPFDESFAAKPPGGLWNRRGIEIDPRAKGDLPDAKGYHQVALYGFVIKPGNGRGNEVRGVLLVIPKDRLNDPPSRSLPDFQDRAENYARRRSRTYHSFAWQTDGFVYVCFVPKDVHSLQVLQQVVAGPNA